MAILHHTARVGPLRLQRVGLRDHLDLLSNLSCRQQKVDRHRGADIDLHILLYLGLKPGLFGPHPISPNGQVGKGVATGHVGLHLAVIAIGDILHGDLGVRHRGLRGIQHLAGQAARLAEQCMGEQ